MKRDNKLGIIGNLDRLFAHLTTVENGHRTRMNFLHDADTENREAVEQSMTDYELDMIQAQQDLTDLQIQILEGTK